VTRQNGIVWVFTFVAVLHGLHTVSDQFTLQKLFFPLCPHGAGFSDSTCKNGISWCTETYQIL